MSFKLNLSGDFSEAENLLSSIYVNAENMPIMLGKFGKRRVKESIKRSFRQQRTPDGKGWEKSDLSQTDPTGSPRLTLIRSTDLFQDMQDDSNYNLNPYELDVTTSVQAKDKDGKETGFFYGEYHNFGKWWFAGLDVEGLEDFSNDVIDFILYGKK